MIRKINIDENGIIKGFDIERKPYNLVTVQNWETRKFIKPVIKLQSDGLYYAVETATPEEIAAFNKQKQFEKDAAFQAKKKSDGIAYADEINTKLIGIMRGKTQAQIDDLDIEFRAKILKYLDLIEGGDWWTAKRMIDNTTLPKITEIKTLFLEVRQHIRNYVNENYI